MDEHADIDIEHSDNSQDCDSDEREIVREIEEDERRHDDFINDRCDFCGLDCGSNWFLKILSEEKPIDDGD